MKAVVELGRMKRESLQDFVRGIPDFPIKGIQFKDITPLSFELGILLPNSWVQARKSLDTDLIERKKYLFTYWLRLRLI